jgi:Ca2+:H+ antiporter
VKLTLLGSIISNLLLVLGSAFIAGGVLHPMQHFNQQGINANCGLLMLAGEPLLGVGYHFLISVSLTARKLLIADLLARCCGVFQTFC